MRDQAQDMLAQLEAGWLGMQWRAIAPQVWVGFAISVVAAWLLWDEGSVWFACAVGTGVIQFMAVKRNQQDFRAALHRRFDKALSDEDFPEVIEEVIAAASDETPRWIEWSQRIAFFAACGLLIAGFII